MVSEGRVGRGWRGGIVGGRGFLVRGKSQKIGPTSVCACKCCADADSPDGAQDACKCTLVFLYSCM